MATAKEKESVFPPIIKCWIKDTSCEPTCKAWDSENKECKILTLLEDAVDYYVYGVKSGRYSNQLE